MHKSFKKHLKIYTIILLLALTINFIRVAQPVAASSLSTPANLNTTSTSYNSISISWSGVSGATGYKLYRASSKTGSYKLLKTTTAKIFENTKLTAGKTYYYKIRAYKISGDSKVYSSYSVIKSGKAIPAIPDSIKATPTSYCSVTINWNSVTGASGYRIYSSATSDGPFTLLKSTKATSYEHTCLTTGSAHYYKVRAYTTVNGTKIFGNYTEIISAKPALSTPESVIAVASPEGTMDISWSEIPGSKGYRIYRVAPDGTVTFLSDTQTAQYSDIGLTSGATYSYKVRAYALVGNSKIYSSYSTVVGGTIPIINVVSVSLDRGDSTLVLGTSDALIATVYPENAANTAVVWSSSDDSVVTVDQKGNLTTQNSGNAVITVMTEDGNMTAECSVTVMKAQINGIDVSKWQGTVDWSLVKNAGIEFAMLRSSYGSNSIDPMFETNYAAAKENGIALGAYHYSYATTIEKAEAEVQFFLSQLEGKQFEYPVCVDVEDSSMSTLDKNTLTDIALTYLTELSEAGYYPMIYSNKTWFTTRLDDTRLTNYDHWLAQWGTSLSYTNSLTLWQYSSTGKIDGISTKVDQDISYVDYASRIQNLGLNGY